MSAVKMTCPTTAELTKPASTGGSAGSFEVTVAITTGGLDPAPYSGSHVNVAVFKSCGESLNGRYNAEFKGGHDSTGPLPPGTEKSQTRTISFHSYVPQKGDKLIVVASYDNVVDVGVVEVSVKS